MIRQYENFDKYIISLLLASKNIEECSAQGEILSLGTLNDCSKSIIMPKYLNIFAAVDEMQKKTHLLQSH